MAILQRFFHQVRVTHETLISRRWAAASLELETNRGRIFTFEPVCSRTPKHKRTIITADPGMEILSIQIKSGALVGYMQQPCGEQSVVNKEWYSVLYQRTKEEEDGVEVKEFSDKRAAGCWWEEVSEGCGKKAGRGALFLDTKKNKILDKTGSKELTADLIIEAEKRGVYLDMKEYTATLSISALLSAISKALLTRQYTIRMFVVIALLLCHKVMDLEILNLTGHLITIISDDTAAYNQSFYGNALCYKMLKCESRFQHIRAVLIGFVLMVILERLAFLGNVLVHVQGHLDIITTLNITSLEKTLSLHQGYHDSHTHSEVNSISNIDSMCRLVTWNFPYALTHGLGIFASAFYLVRANPTIGRTAIVLTALFNVLYVMPSRTQAMTLEKCRIKLLSGAENLKDEAIQMVSTIKQFSQEELHVKEQKLAEKSWLSCERSLVLIKIQHKFAEHSFKYFLLAFMIAYELCASESIFEPGDLMMFYIMYDSFQNQLIWLNVHIKLLEEDLSGVENYVDFIDTPCEMVSGSDTVGSLEEDIQLEDVHFGYPTRIGETVFSGLNLKIQRKKMTALVGDSGSGKTTIAKLLMRLYDPQQGKVTIGGKDIRDFDLKELHGKMAIVSQDPSLLNTTLVENISYGAATPEQISMKRVKKAAELANCDFINKFRSGMDTFAGSQGLQISGGQKQRVAIARAAMRDPDILILDEATSALDAQNEKEVQGALDKLMKGKTTIVIAHRLSTIRQADEIICLKDGEVKERGTHEQLMELGKYYANLVSKQLVEDTCKKMKESVVSGEDVKRLMKQASQELVGQVSHSKSKNKTLDDVASEECPLIGEDGPLFVDCELDENNLKKSKEKSI